MNDEFYICFYLITPLANIPNIEKDFGSKLWVNSGAILRNSFWQLPSRTPLPSCITFPLDNISDVERGDVLHGQLPIFHKNPAQAWALERTLRHCFTTTAKHGKQHSTDYKSTFDRRGTRRHELLPTVFDVITPYCTATARLKLSNLQLIRCWPATILLHYWVRGVSGYNYPKWWFANNALSKGKKAFYPKPTRKDRWF